MPGSAVECRDLAKSFGPVTALRGADLTLTPHSLTALLGPSGCGKTTLLRVVAGFERADVGTVRVGDRMVEGPGVHVPPERRHITIVPQEQALFPHLTVAENVGYGMRRGRAGGRGRRMEAGTRRAVEHMLEVAGLGGLGPRMPNELSGGQQQRVALARALAPEPSVVLLDEPFGSLDAALRIEIQAEVATILRTTGATALLVTHDQEEALSMADTVAVMRDGRIVQHAPPDEIYRRPADLWVAGFVGSANLLPGRMTGASRVTCVLGELPVAAGTPSLNGQGDAVSVVVRPEQVRLAAGEGEGLGIVEHRQYFGHDALVRVALPDGSHVVARTASAEPLPAGARVSVRCEGEVVCFPAG